ncbi:SDR family oxidoreductase [Sneathiella marina]|uniref:SDR family oxidoreductase n=1 Tax=Sneathiella marina TaxID=2950108 RepID=A0ABY4W1D0_9PROT|nr:SDR family oxidoreductase [Sneathiella marina]USG59642.1 SDR family oxidoreductase [Sneathiella marina]
MQLENKTILITGATSGIGLSAARLFAQQGAALILGARRQPELNAICESINNAGGRAVSVPGDVGEEEYAKKLVDTAMERFGKLDGSFNNAGILGDLGSITELSTEGWEAVIKTNLTAAFFGAKYQIPALLEQPASSMIFTSSFVGYTTGISGMAAYAASKAGLIGLTQTLAAEYGAQGLRVNALLPGGTETPMGDVVMTTTEIKSYFDGLHSLKRQAMPIEIAQSALYLASDASSFVTGTAHLADGGISIFKA